MPTTTKMTPSLAEAKAALDARLTELDNQIDATSDELADASLDAELATGDLRANATAKVQAISKKLATLKDDRDAAARAITRAGHREEEAIKKAADAAVERAKKQDAKLTTERAAVYDEIAAVIKQLAQLTRKAVDLDRLIDVTRQQADPATREHLFRQSVSRIRDVLNTVMCEHGFDRDWEWPHPAKRIHNPNEYQ